MTDIIITQTHIDAWDYLIVRLENESAVAGVMGYFQARTGFNLLNGFYDSGISEGLDMNSFVHDKKPYGIGAWSNWATKQSWWNLAKATGNAMCSLQAQLDIFCDELSGQTYKHLYECLKEAENPEDAADLMFGLYLGEKNWDYCRQDTIREYAHFFYSAFVRMTHIVKYVRVSSDSVKVRKSPTVISKKVGVARKNDIYPYITMSKNLKWCSIYYDGNIRWIPVGCYIVEEVEETYGNCNHSVNC